jgi:phosphoglycolate phosphatase-like HAD superfamily hydrolase
VIRAVIFDLDGTLIDLPLDYEKLLGQFSRILRVSNVRPLTETVAGLDDEARRKIFKVWDGAELALVERIKLKDEGMALYRKYCPKPKALVTMQGKALVQAILGPLGLSFEFVLTREDSLDRVEQLQEAIKKLKADSGDVLFIGNTEGDLQATETIKCQFLRVE